MALRCLLAPEADWVTRASWAAAGARTGMAGCCSAAGAWLLSASMGLGWSAASSSSPCASGCSAHVYRLSDAGESCCETSAAVYLPGMLQ